MDKSKAFASLPPFAYTAISMAERRNKWHTWKRGFEICLRAAKVTEPVEKKDLLLAQGGFELQEIFFNIPGADVNEDKEKNIDPYVVAMDKLDHYFAPLRHEAHERYMFWSMKPEPDESLEKFLMRAQVNAGKCNLGKTTVESSNIAVIDKMLQFVPIQLRERLLHETELTLEEVIKQVNAFETTRLASEQISGLGILQQTKPQPIENVQHIQINCKFCGKCHMKGRCPAWNKTCSNCGKRGHFHTVCFGRTGINLDRSTPELIQKQKRSFGQSFPSHSRPFGSKRIQSSRRLHAITDAESDSELIEMVSSASDSDELVWTKVGGVMIEMQIDSGAQSNIIDNKTWNVMRRNGVQINGEIQHPDKKFKAYAQENCLVVQAMFDAEIIISDGDEQLRSDARFYVIQDGPQPLLGKKTATELGVLMVGLPSQQEQIRNINTFRRFPSIRGVKIHLPVDYSIRPVVQRLRRLPFATLTRVEEKLNELLVKDVIEKVSEPSRWVSPLVVVIKDSGDIRLCIDMRQVNKAILRETHPLPTIEDIRWKLNGAVYFSRLDIKDAFYQLELDEESKPLTTFITHKGLYRYKRLVFGISCAPEMFQKVIEQILSDCKNAINFIDDIVVVGSTEQEHDEALRDVLDKCRDYNILLNESKCVYKLNEIDFLGHRFNQQGITPSQSKIDAIASFRSPNSCEEVRSFLGLINYFSDGDR
ncbi:uncharacterized protein LOC131434165 [Malaya genurostris]|uniref:uncharacterized protein LOC131434165 n=1 Tax=Malaya genurostris TaxID=325434 RepID=UPI0026F3B64C|nr:uncharacterized protein LOC131434165 [Malaya genurostris]